MQVANLRLQQDLSEARCQSARQQQQMQQQAQLVDAVEAECNELRGALTAARTSFDEQRAFGAAPGSNMCPSSAAVLYATDTQQGRVDAVAKHEERVHAAVHDMKTTLGVAVLTQHAASAMLHGSLSPRHICADALGTIWQAASRCRLPISGSCARRCKRARRPSARVHVRLSLWASSCQPRARSQITTWQACSWDEDPCDTRLWCLAGRQS